MQRPNFISDKVDTSKGTINVHVFTDYDKLDALALKKGYKPTKCALDETVEHSGLIGAQNSNLHCGWIATMGDKNHISIEDQIKHLNRKIESCKSKNEQILIGFCQTGNFSIGYTIYVKR